MTVSPHCSERRARGARRGLLWLALALPIAIAVGSIGEPPRALAGEPQTLTRGLADWRYLVNDASTRARWLDASVTADAGLLRMNVYWRDTVSGAGPPADAGNPGDPAYAWGKTDAAVRDARARGFRIMFTVLDAPDWAEGSNRPENGVPSGTWKPNPKALGAFGEALARRYSGTFKPAASETPLPAVSYFEAWNEPNLSVYLTPQYRGDRTVGAAHYRKMANGFHAGVKRGNGSAKVVVGATAPFGEDGPNAERTRPLIFMREVLCLSGRTAKLRADRCRQPARFDIYSHHPIGIYGGPRDSSTSPDDVSAAIDMDRVVRTLRFAERHRTIATRGRHPVWATEFFWQSNPPEDSQWAFPVRTQSRWVQEAFYLLWKNQVSTGIYFQLVDDPFQGVFDPGLQAGLILEDGTPKPSFQAFRFPFVMEHKRKSRAVAWTIPPASGAVTIEKSRGGDWKAVKRIRGRSGRPAVTKLAVRGRGTFRASVGGQQSLGWRYSK